VTARHTMIGVLSVEATHASAPPTGRPWSALQHYIYIKIIIYCCDGSNILGILRLLLLGSSWDGISLGSTRRVPAGVAFSPPAAFETRVDGGVRVPAHLPPPLRDRPQRARVCCQTAARPVSCGQPRRATALSSRVVAPPPSGFKTHTCSKLCARDGRVCRRRIAGGARGGPVCDCQTPLGRPPRPPLILVLTDSIHETTQGDFFLP